MFTTRNLIPFFHFRNTIKVSLLISTYNFPEAIRLCLMSVTRQTLLPDEIVIADDGSDERTRNTIDTLRPYVACDIKHVWQEDLGFRVASIRNKALAACSGDYVIQIDGDIIMGRNFIADHVRHARIGYFAAGSRCRLNERITKRILQISDYSPSFFNRDLIARENAIRLPIITPFLKRYKRTIGCNMAFWLKDIIAINGYNEDMEGWGHEDIELAERLIRNGVCRQHLKFCAIGFHIYHKERSREFEDHNMDIVHRNRINNVRRINNGISKHLQKE